MGKKGFAFLHLPKDEKPTKAVVTVGRLVYPGDTHSMAVEDAVKDHGGWDKFMEKGLPAGGSGFATSGGRIVGRKEATAMANKTKVKMKDRKYLHGEDL